MANGTPRAQLLLAIAALALFIAPLQTWLMLGGDLTEHLRYETLPGQATYVLSKLCALYAIELVWLQAMLGLLRHQVIAVGLAPSTWKRAHATLGLAALAFVVAHVTLFIAATSMRNRISALDLLLPWGSGVYRTWVAFGAAALWLIFVGAAVQAALQLSVAKRRWLHQLTLVGLGLAVIHSLAIGTESRSGTMAWAAGTMAVLLVAAALHRVFSALRDGHDKTKLTQRIEGTS